MEKGYHQRASLASIRLQVCTPQTHHTNIYHRKSLSTQMHRISNTTHITQYPADFKAGYVSVIPQIHHLSTIDLKESLHIIIFHGLKYKHGLKKSLHYSPSTRKSLHNISSTAWNISTARKSLYIIYHWLERKSSHYLPRLDILARLERVFTLSTSAWKRAFTKITAWKSLQIIYLQLDKVSTLIVNTGLNEVVTHTLNLINWFTIYVEFLLSCFPDM